jgi:hypothetical protein
MTHTAKPTPEQRAQAIAAKAKTQPSIDERRLNATLDRSISRDWYSITKPNCEPIRVHFNPPQTIEEVRTRWYPGCGVLPA